MNLLWTLLKNWKLAAVAVCVLTTLCAVAAAGSARNDKSTFELEVKVKIAALESQRDNAVANALASDANYLTIRNTAQGLIKDVAEVSLAKVRVQQQLALTQNTVAHLSAAVMTAAKDDPDVQECMRMALPAPVICLLTDGCAQASE